MTLPIEELWNNVFAQRERVPSLYGDFDFSVVPERFCGERTLPPQLDDPYGHMREQILADRSKVERIRAYTMLGDPVADAYAALMPQYGFRALVAMLKQACADGVEAVDNAPPELAAFIAAIEEVPAWLDLDLVREGARIERNEAANVSPFIIRGTFVGTFMNKYAALPMALTGQLSNETAARRIRETASFFATTVLPGALERHGAGFLAAAMVRLMHSMVRFNALKRSKAWNVRVHGIPIPQVDQMPAGLMSCFIRAFGIVARGRKEYTHAERASLEIARYRCHLLGMSVDLLPDTPQGLVDIMLIRDQTVRRGFDDATCGALVRATLAAYLPLDQSWGSRLRNRVERGFSKIFFIKLFLSGDRDRATRMGVVVERGDLACYVLCALYVGLRAVTFGVLQRIPGIRDLADRLLVRRIIRILAGYGHAEFVTNADQYRPATASGPSNVAA